MRIGIFLLSLLFFTSAYSAAVPAFYGDVKQVNVNNASISYYRFGSGKPLVMIIGHGDYMNMWSPEFLKKISANHTVVIFDYPGIGKSTIQGAFPNSMSQLADIVTGFIQTQHFTKPDLLGFSMGGSLTLFIATQHSSDYDHVIVIGAKAGGKKTIAPDPKFFNMLKEPNVPPAVAIKTLLFPASASKEADAYIKTVTSFPSEKMDGAALAAQSEAVSAENNGPGIWDQLTNIQNKTLIINGTEDVLTPVQNAPIIAAAIPNAWLAQIKGAGHGVLFQEPDFIFNLVDLFLRY